LSLPVTARHHGDPPQFPVLPGRIRVTRTGGGRPPTQPDPVLADKAYSSRANRTYPRSRDIRCPIPQPADQKHHRTAQQSASSRPPASAPHIDNQRHALQCSINHRNHNHAAATPYDTLAARYETTLIVTATNESL
jgi:hypothetical protein